MKDTPSFLTWENCFQFLGDETIQPIYFRRSSFWSFSSHFILFDTFTSTGLAGVVSEGQRNGMNLDMTWCKKGQIVSYLGEIIVSRFRIKCWSCGMGGIVRRLIFSVSRDLEELIMEYFLAWLCLYLSRHREVMCVVVILCFMDFYALRFC